jgi:hypothetical protein
MKVRIVKRGRNESSNSIKPAEEKTSRQSTREIASIIKGWVAELEQRHRAGERASSPFMK